MASLSVRDLVVGESDPFVDVVVRLDAPATQTVTVNYGLAQDTASNGFDFRNVSGTLTFAPGETVKTVRVDIVADTTVEGLEQFRFNLSSPVNATIAQASAMIAIIDNDTVVALRVSAARSGMTPAPEGATADVMGMVDRRKRD